MLPFTNISMQVALFHMVYQHPKALTEHQSRWEPSRDTVGNQRCAPAAAPHLPMLSALYAHPHLLSTSGRAGDEHTLFLCLSPGPGQLLHIRTVLLPSTETSDNKIGDQTAPLARKSDAPSVVCMGTATTVSCLKMVSLSILPPPASSGWMKKGES